MIVKSALLTTIFVILFVCSDASQDLTGHDVTHSIRSPFDEDIDVSASSEDLNFTEHSNLCKGFHTFIDDFVSSLWIFPARKLNGLIVLQDKEDPFLDNLATKGTCFCGNFTRALFELAFDEKSAFKDGAMLIKLSQTKQPVIFAVGIPIPEIKGPAQEGLDLSLKTDAFILVTFADHSRLSMAKNGRMIEGSKEKMRRHMRGRLTCKTEPEHGSAQWNLPHVGFVFIIVVSCLLFVLLIVFVPRDWMRSYFNNVHS